MERKKLGIIGGMGPLASANFYQRVTNQTKASCDQEHLNIVVSSHSTLPDRTTLILNGRQAQFIQAVEEDLRLMEYANVGHIAIPCNTAHYFYDEMQKITAIPIINMVEETMKEILDRFGSTARVGILATRGTIQSNVYAKYAERFGFDLVIPNESEQQLVMDAIYAIKAGDFKYLSEFEQLLNKMKSEYNCDVSILACTELSLFSLNEESKAISVDAMDVLVKQSILKSGYNLI